MMLSLARRIVDRRVLHLIKMWHLYRPKPYFPHVVEGICA